MSVRSIRLLGDPVLWTPCSPLSESDLPRASGLIEDLRDTLEDFRRRRGFGRGIAAPQIGEPLRILYVRLPDGQFTGAMINPEIVWQSEERVELWDDCFSFPDLLVCVSRSAAVRVRYVDGQGKPTEVEAQSDFSELLQHEIDHLDGVLAVNRAVSPQAFALRTEWEKIHGPLRPRTA